MENSEDNLAVSENGTEFKVNDNGEALGTGNDARVDALSRIADNADREREEEFQDIVDLETGQTEKFVAPSLEESEEQAAERADQEAAAALQAAQQAESEEAAATGQAPQTIRVNGQDVILTPELIAKAQKVAAADVYLSEAARMRNELASKVPANKQTEAIPDQAGDLLAIAQAIQMGTEEEAVEAIRKLTKAGPSKDDIAQTVREQLLFETALKNYRTEYPDIVGDPILNKLAIEEDDRLVRAGDSRSYEDRFKAIGESLRTWVGSKAPKQQETQTQTSNKLERKAAASGFPQAAGARTKSSVQEEKEETVQSVIAEMAASRGSPQWMQQAAKAN